MTQAPIHPPVPAHRRVLRPSLIFVRSAALACGLSAFAGLSGPVVSSPNAPVPRLTFHNVTIATHDLNGMSAWYARTLGLDIEERGRFDAVQADYMMLVGHGLRIEMVSRRDAPTRFVDRTEPPGHLDVLGLKALVFETDDLPGLTARLQARGVDIVWADQQISQDRRSTLIRDPEGNLVNLFGSRQIGDGA